MGGDIRVGFEDSLWCLNRMVGSPSDFRTLMQVKTCRPHHSWLGLSGSRSSKKPVPRLPKGEPWVISALAQTRIQSFKCPNTGAQIIGTQAIQRPMVRIEVGVQVFSLGVEKE